MLSQGCQLWASFPSASTTSLDYSVVKADMNAAHPPMEIFSSACSSSVQGFQRSLKGKSQMDRSAPERLDRDSDAEIGRRRSTKVLQVTSCTRDLNGGNGTTGKTSAEEQS